MTKYMFAALAMAAVAAPAVAQQNPAFTGPRVEGVVGYDNVGLPGLNNPDGVTYGAGVGFDFAAGGLLVGVEAEATDSTAQLKLIGPNLKAGRDLYVGGRVGTIVGGTNLIYVKGGYTNARFKLAGTGAGNADGFRVGAGVEHALSTNSFIKAEYRYSNYESDLSRNQVVAGFGFRF